MLTALLFGMVIIQASIQQTNNSDDHRKKHILLVDDDPAFRAFTAMLLTKNGYHVSQACDGKEALQLIEETRCCCEYFDLLVTDLKMENMSGIELIHSVRALGNDIPVLIATGYLDEFSFTVLNNTIRHKLLIKPFKPEELLQNVEQLIAIS